MDPSGRWGVRYRKDLLHDTSILIEHHDGDLPGNFIKHHLPAWTAFPRFSLALWAVGKVGADSANWRRPAGIDGPDPVPDLQSHRDWGLTDFWKSPANIPRWTKFRAPVTQVDRGFWAKPEDLT